MTRFYGEIGYGKSEQVPADSGIWVDVITEYSYFGDVTRNANRLDDGSGLNNNVSVSNSISVLADDRAFKNFHMIRYIRWAGALWTVSSVEVQSPRLIIRLGDVYNGPTA